MSVCPHKHMRPWVHLQLKYGKNIYIYFLFSEKEIFIIKSGWLINFSQCISFTLLLFHKLDSVTDLFSVSRKHSTLPTTLELSKIINYCIFLQLICRKCPAENARNGIFETLNLRIFWGRMLPDPSKLGLHWRHKYFPSRVYLQNLTLHPCLFHPLKFCSFAIDVLHAINILVA